MDFNIFARFDMLCKKDYNFKASLDTILGGCQMLSVEKARRKTDKARKAYLKKEWKKLSKKLKKTTAKGKRYSFSVKELSPEASTRLKAKGYTITKDGNNHDIVSWEYSLSKK